MSRPVLQMKGISKSFPGVKALNQVDFNVYPGEVMALLGENGAGKSTLMKILSGVYAKDEGEIYLDGQELVITTPSQATAAGIAIIHQELNLIPHLKVYENIFLGRELSRAGLLDKPRMIEQAGELLHRLGVTISPTDKLLSLSIAQQQMVEIAKALSLDARIFIMDEPTDTLTDREVTALFDIIRELKRNQRSIVYISHRLKEVFQICDRLTVLRDGELIAEQPVARTTESDIIRLMVGRELDEQFPYMNYVKPKEVLRVEQLNNQFLNDISFSVNEGEIFGISGLVGAGRTELAKTLYGVYPYQSGSITLHQKPYHAASPAQALKQGLSYVTEDRKHDGLILMMPVRSNMTLSALKQFVGPWGIDRRKENKVASDYRQSMNIRTPSLNQLVKFLSGGNQQKVALAKSLLSQPEVLILDEPTRGVDVGAKREIYDLLNDITRQGKAVIMISSEMPELLGMCDRIMVMQGGSNKGILERSQATQEKIMSLIMQEREDL